MLACDEAYAMPLATTLRSIVEANVGNWPLDCHILTDGFSETGRRRVCESLPDGAATIHWVPVGMELFRGFHTVPGVSAMTSAPVADSSRLPRCRIASAIPGHRHPRARQRSGALGDKSGRVGRRAVLDGVDRHLKSGTRSFAGVPRVRNYLTQRSVSTSTDGESNESRRRRWNP